jgi:predicted CXXCH cytochrome family protein
MTPAGRPSPIRFLAALLPLVPVAFWLGCTAEKKYQVLSFFFDGVPNPHAPAATRPSDQFPTGGQVATAGGGTLFVHKPYFDNQCNACHRGELSPENTPTNTTCQTCHAAERTRYPWMHGPVAVGECLACHLPHESPFSHLLRGPSAAVCNQCHETALLDPGVPQHLDASANCLECHYGHGGDRPPFLRVAAATTLPATRPATGGGRP